MLIKFYCVLGYGFNERRIWRVVIVSLFGFFLNLCRNWVLIGLLVFCEG